MSTPNRENRIRTLLGQLKPSRLEILNESGQHSRPGTDTHFRVLIVAEAFHGLGRVARSRMVNELLAEEYSSGLHALSLRCLCPDEVEKSKDFQSPKCHSLARE